MKTKDEKRKARKKITAEDFTPPELVREILDKLDEYGPEAWEEGKVGCDLACGNGNILVEILKRKLSLNHDPLISIQSVYGADIMQDNIRECRTRLLNTIKEHGHKITKEMIKAVLKNIVWTPLCRYPNGSLDYDFNFSRCPDQKDIDRWYDDITGDKKNDSKANDNELVEAVKQDNIFTAMGFTF